jgi:hypothetical protein
MEEIVNKVKINKAVYAESIMEALQRSVMNALMESGFSIEDEQSAKDSNLVLESLRSAWFRKLSLHHDLHHVADQCFEVKKIKGQNHVNFIGKRDDVPAKIDNTPPDILA